MKSESFDACRVSKVTQASFKRKHLPSSCPFEEIHTDLIGPITPLSQGGHQYILTIFDSSTRCCAAIPLKAKSDTPDVLMNLINLEAKIFGFFLYFLHQTEAVSWLTGKFLDFCVKNFIKRLVSDAYTPQKNGLAEIFDCTILETLKRTLVDSTINSRLWHEIPELCTLIINQFPAHKSKSSPFELFKVKLFPSTTSIQLETKSIISIFLKDPSLSENQKEELEF